MENEAKRKVVEMSGHLLGLVAQASPKSQKQAANDQTVYNYYNREKPFLWLSEEWTYQTDLSRTHFLLQMNPNYPPPQPMSHSKCIN